MGSINEFLSGLKGEGTTQTQSTFLEFKTSAIVIRWPYVIGLNPPPIIPMFIFSLLKF